MADLNEEVITVVRKKWDRAYKIRIDNEYNKTPKITFEIQTVTTDNDQLVGATPKSIINVDFDPNIEYPLINPLDDSIISETGGNHTNIQVQLYSLFKHLVKW